MQNIAIRFNFFLSPVYPLLFLRGGYNILCWIVSVVFIQQSWRYGVLKTGEYVRKQCCSCLVQRYQAMNLAYWVWSIQEFSKSHNVGNQFFHYAGGRAAYGFDDLRVRVQKEKWHLITCSFLVLTKYSSLFHKTC